MGFAGVFVATRIAPSPGAAKLRWFFVGLEGGLYILFWLGLLIKYSMIGAPPLIPVLPLILFGGSIAALYGAQKAEQGAAANP